MKKIVSRVRKAVEDYDMIADGDRIAVGVSGGKDSLVLLGALANLSRFYPKKFEVKALTLDMGYNADWSGVYKYCEEIGVSYTVKRTNIKEVVFDYRQEENPCSLCSKLRRGALNDLALDEGCNKVALGHHNDDVLETFMLSLLYEGRINCFSPVTYLDRTNLYSIRPLIYVRECDIKSVAKRLELPIVKSSCPADGNTKRQEMKEIIKTLDKSVNAGLKKRMFTAIQNGKIEGWDRK
ncbi:MAG: tRNA 2-thiocytidine(32) synthetase TtcA [Clostridia bacterium]|nr:tRNA 2-thiocytidine(32) synthetase TtcA [Clostridia bacterium]MBQ7751512.1 tRNA 2-thiocytidine(32) synthetase TtcA [Clostridia bacterium]